MTSDWSSSPAPAGQRSEMQKPPAEVDPWGSPVLARSATLVVQMDERAGGGEARDCRTLASRRVWLVLAFPFAPQRRPTENHPRASPPHPVHGGGESDLGRSADPR